MDAFTPSSFEFLHKYCYTIHADDDAKCVHVVIGGPLIDLLWVKTTVWSTHIDGGRLPK